VAVWLGGSDTGGVAVWLGGSWGVVSLLWLWMGSGTGGLARFCALCVGGLGRCCVIVTLPRLQSINRVSANFDTHTLNPPPFEPHRSRHSNGAPKLPPNHCHSLHQRRFRLLSNAIFFFDTFFFFAIDHNSVNIHFHILQPPPFEPPRSPFSNGTTTIDPLPPALPLPPISPTRTCRCHDLILFFIDHFFL
jgi:hypothetical protein